MDDNISNQEKKTPFGVKIIAVLSILLSLYPVISGTIEFFQESNNSSESGWIFVLYLPFLILFYTLAFWIISIAIMLWKGKNRARIILLIFFVIAIFLNLGLCYFSLNGGYSFSLKGNTLIYAIYIITETVFSLFAIFYLIFNKKVKEFFKKPTE